MFYLEIFLTKKDLNILTIKIHIFFILFYYLRNKSMIVVLCIFVKRTVKHLCFKIIEYEDNTGAITLYYSKSSMNDRQICKKYKNKQSLLKEKNAQIFFRL